MGSFSPDKRQLLRRRRLSIYVRQPPQLAPVLSLRRAQRSVDRLMRLSALTQRRATRVDADRLMRWSALAQRRATRVDAAVSMSGTTQRHRLVYVRKGHNSSRSGDVSRNPSLLLQRSRTLRSSSHLTTLGTASFCE